MGGRDGNNGAGQTRRDAAIEVCVTAQSLYHGHVPAKKLGLKGAGIDRKGALGEMAEEVERHRSRRTEVSVANTRSIMLIGAHRNL